METVISLFVTLRRPRSCAALEGRRPRSCRQRVAPSGPCILRGRALARPIVWRGHAGARHLRMTEPRSNWPGTALVAAATAARPAHRSRRRKWRLSGRGRFAPTA